MGLLPLLSGPTRFSAAQTPGPNPWTLTVPNTQQSSYLCLGQVIPLGSSPLCSGLRVKLGDSRGSKNEESGSPSIKVDAVRAPLLIPSW